MVLGTHFMLTPSTEGHRVDYITSATTCVVTNFTQ